MGLLWDPTGGVFLMSEVPVYGCGEGPLRPGGRSARRLAFCACKRFWVKGPPPHPNSLQYSHTLAPLLLFFFITLDTGGGAGGRRAA